MRRVDIAFVLAALLGGAACGGGGSTGPGSDQSGPNPGNASSATMAAQVGASSWHAAVVIATRSADGTIGVSGSDNSTFIVGFKVKGTATGSFPIPDCSWPGGSDRGTNGGSVGDFAGTRNWGTDCSHTGAVTITSISSDGVSGTFNFELAPSSGTAATTALSVSAGTFTAKF